ncbi:MAG: hypothetical protein WCC69_10225 [Pirellulales bacterium]
MNADAAAGQAPQTNPLYEFSPRDLITAYQAGDYDAMSRQLLSVLDYLRDTTFQTLDVRTVHALNAFTKHFLYFFTQEDFSPSDTDLAAFVARNAVIANLAAMTEFGSTDPFVQILLGQSRNFTKLLAIYSPRNRIHIDPRLLFNTNPVLATKWYFACVENYRSDCADKGTLEKLRGHIRYEDDRMSGELGASHHTYFGATYIDHEHDYLVKQRINRLFQSTPIARRQITNTPKPKRIAVITAMWWPGQSVYRSQAPFIHALAKDHELVLIHLGRPRSDIDTRGFAEVRSYNASGDATDLSAIDPNDFAMAYFPDIGMTIESLILANMRIAPIQVSNYGHPVSTFGAKIDYWIGGRDTEDPNRAQEHYSERLVLIPGCAQAPVPITHPLAYPQLPETPVIIDCSWAGQKINDDHLQRLAEMVRRVRTPVRFKFFPGGSVLENRYLPLKKAIDAVLGPHRVQVFGNIGYPTYMTELEAAHFALDAHPFGGYNTAVDLLTLRKPIVTLEGNRFYNRSTAYLLRKAGLDELVASTPEEYIDLGVRMIDDAGFRDRMIRRLKIADLATTVLSHEHVPSFVRAIDLLLQRHDEFARQSGRDPIHVD